MNFLLDTCVISELVKPAPDPHVVTWLKSSAAEQLFLSVVTVGEIRKGLTKLPASKRKDALTVWLQKLVAEYSDRILPVNLAVAENWGIMQGEAEQRGMPMAALDSLIAAVARTHKLVIATRNERDFAASKVPLVNPWTARQPF